MKLLLLGFIMSMVSAYGAMTHRTDFFRAYLVAYLFWFAVSLGAYFVSHIHHLSGGGWGRAIRRFLEPATQTLPLMLLLFIPIVIGMADIFPWMNSKLVAESRVLQHKSLYLNGSFFVLRAAVYFALWIGFTAIVNGLSKSTRLEPNRANENRLKIFAALGIVIYAVTIFLASVDWVTSLEPDWYSSIFGLLFMVSQALSAMTFSIIALHVYVSRKPEAATEQDFHDLGNLSLAFMMLWAYMSFSQFLIIWAGNLPEEIHWYLHRSQGNWSQVVIVIAIFHFALPFFFLLMRALKRNRNYLVCIAALLLVMRYVEITWLVKPTFYHDFTLSWLDLSALLSIGGLWMAAFLSRFENT